MKATLTPEADGRHFRCRCPYSPALVERFRTFPGREWDRDAREWRFPLVKDVLHMVCDAVGVLPWTLGEELRRVAGVDGYQAVQRVALDLSVLHGITFLTEPYAHQRKNLARLLTNARWLLA